MLTLLKFKLLFIAGRWNCTRYYRHLTFKISLTDAVLIVAVEDSTIVRKCSCRLWTDRRTEVRGETVNLYLISRRSRPTINVTAETSDSVCTPHHPGRAFDVAHGYPLPPAFERTPSIPISRHHDILLLIRRHRPSPISPIPLSPASPKAEPPFLTTGPPRLTRPPLGCLIFRLSRFSSPAARRRITDAHTGEITRRRKNLLLQVDSGVLLSSRGGWFRSKRIDTNLWRSGSKKFHFQLSSYISTRMRCPRKSINKYRLSLLQIL